ncbi:MAG: hypothetical protein ACFBSD_10675 [Paracoccaceae bacterium]
MTWILDRGRVSTTGMPPPSGPDADGVTIADNPQIVYDSDPFNGGTGADVPFSGTVTRAGQPVAGGLVELRIESEDGTSFAGPYSKILTADALGRWSTTLPVPKNKRWLRARARIANNPGVTALQSDVWGVGYVILGQGQSLMSDAFFRKESGGATKQPNATIATLDGSDEPCLAIAVLQQNYAPGQTEADVEWERITATGSHLFGHLWANSLVWKHSDAVVLIADNSKPGEGRPALAQDSTSWPATSFTAIIDYIRNRGSDISLVNEAWYNTDSLRTQRLEDFRVWYLSQLKDGTEAKLGDDIAATFNFWNVQRAAGTPPPGILGEYFFDKGRTKFICAPGAPKYAGGGRQIEKALDGLWKEQAVRRRNFRLRARATMATAPWTEIAAGDGIGFEPLNCEPEDDGLHLRRQTIWGMAASAGYLMASALKAYGVTDWRVPEITGLEIVTRDNVDGIECLVDLPNGGTLSTADASGVGLAPGGPATQPWHQPVMGLEWYDPETQVWSPSVFVSSIVDPGPGVGRIRLVPKAGTSIRQDTSIRHLWGDSGAIYDPQTDTPKIAEDGSVENPTNYRTHEYFPIEVGGALTGLPKGLPVKAIAGPWHVRDAPGQASEAFVIREVGKLESPNLGPNRHIVVAEIDFRVRPESDHKLTGSFTMFDMTGPVDSTLFGIRNEGNLTGSVHDVNNTLFARFTDGPIDEVPWYGRTRIVVAWDFVGETYGVWLNGTLIRGHIGSGARVEHAVTSGVTQMTGNRRFRLFPGAPPGISCDVFRMGVWMGSSGVMSPFPTDGSGLTPEGNVNIAGGAINGATLSRVFDATAGDTAATFNNPGGGWTNAAPGFVDP